METIADHFKGRNALETIHTGETQKQWRTVNLTWGTFFTPGFKPHHPCYSWVKLTQDQS